MTLRLLLEDFLPYYFMFFRPNSVFSFSSSSFFSALQQPHNTNNLVPQEMSSLWFLKLIVKCLDHCAWYAMQVFSLLPWKSYLHSYLHITSAMFYMVSLCKVKCFFLFPWTPFQCCLIYCLLLFYGLFYRPLLALGYPL